MFRVLQFNIQFGQVWDDEDPDNAPVNLGAAIDEIREHDADILLLQEVEHAKGGGEQVQPPPNYTRLCTALAGYDSWFAYPRPDPRELPFGIGLAIFSRTPLHDRVRRDLPSPPVEFDFYGRRLTPTDRLLIGAKTKIENHEIKIFNTHLLAFFMLGTSSTIHPFQRTMVANQISSWRGPTLIGGDFNVSEHEELIAQYAEKGFHTVQDEEVTWRRRAYVLDHIFYNSRLRCVGYKVKPTMASDHHVLIADFEIV